MIVAATVVAVVINFLGIDPITALVITAIIIGLLAAPLLVLVMLVSNDRTVMGRANEQSTPQRAGLDHDRRDGRRRDRARSHHDRRLRLEPPLPLSFCASDRGPSG